MLFKKEDLLEGLCGDKRFETIEKEIIDQGRWDTHYDWTFKFEGKFYNTQYSSGSTENCDTRPFEDDGDEIECDEVFEAVIATTKYVTAAHLETMRGSSQLIYPKLT